MVSDFYPLETLIKHVTYRIRYAMDNLVPLVNKPFDVVIIASKPTISKSKTQYFLLNPVSIWLIYRHHRTMVGHLQVCPVRHLRDPVERLCPGLPGPDCHLRQVPPRLPHVPLPPRPHLSRPP